MRRFTPRLRGCASASSLCSRATYIYPAPAGVYLLAVCCTDFSGDLPRACGDIPPTEYKRQHGLRFTPRLRGCTQERRASDFAAAIYPAPAGMYPTIPITMASSIYLPRACGGVPASQKGEDPINSRSPQHGAVPTRHLLNLPIQLPRVGADNGKTRSIRKTAMQIY